jgi:release factor glutamine methyltransferase
MSLISIQAILQNHVKQLQAALKLDSSSARIEVQCLLQTALKVSRTYLLTYPEQTIAADQYARYLALFERRLAGEPVAYLLGEREFYGLMFNVTTATLIPRPETELLVELSLQCCGREAAILPGNLRLPACAGFPKKDKYRVLDLGTGSGVIALSIAHARPNVDVTAVDISDAALAVARSNMQKLKLGNVRLLRSNWFSELHNEKFDIIVSNPPYIAADDTHLQQGDVRFEPRIALTSGEDGLRDIRHIVIHAKEHLNVGGRLFIEHGYKHAALVHALFEQAGYCEVDSTKDLAGIERVSVGIWR